MTEHTPGPWKVSPLEDRGFKIHPANNPDFKICRIENAITYLMAFDEKAKPDANLIAAAPELLDVLDRLSQFPFAHQGVAEGPLAVLLSQAKAVIAKARSQE